MIIKEYSENEWKSIEIINYLIENENYNLLKCIFMDILNKYKQFDVVDIINDYEYVKY